MDPNTTMDTSTSSSYSLVVSYLMNSCGLSEVQALKASKKLNFKTTSRADIVKTLLERSGFTKPDIRKLIIRAPKTLVIAERSILKQKLDYFFSKDISRQEAIKALSHNPYVLFFSLKDRIIPCFDFFKSIVGNDRDTIYIVRNVFELKMYYGKSKEELVLINIQVLKDENVPKKMIIKFLIKQPRVFMVGTERFKEAVEEVKCMGINPSKTAFTNSIRMSICHMKTSLETKADAFRKWWSEEQLQTAIRRLTRFMEISVKKFEAIMDFAVTQMGCSPSSLALRPSIFCFSLEKRTIPRFSIHKILISKGLLQSKASILTILQFNDEVFLKRYVIPYKVEAPEVWQIYNQASNRHVLKDSKNEEVTFCRESSTENASAPPKVAKVIDKSQTGKPKNKALPSDLMEQDEELEKEEEANKSTKPKKILRKSKKKVEEMQGGGAKKDNGDHSNIEFDEEEKDKSNREEEIAAVPIVGKVSEGSQASGLKRKVLKKVTKPKKVLKKSKKKIEEVQGSADKEEEKDTSKEEEDSPKKNLVINFGVEAPEQLQVSTRHAMEDSQREEVTFSPKSPTKTAPPKVAKVADKSQTGKPKKKTSTSDLMKQDEELKNEEEAKKATNPKKILSKKKLEKVQGGGAKKDKGSHSNIEFNEGAKDKFEEEEEIAAVPIVGNVLEGSQINVLKRKVALDKEEDSKKVKRPKKILVKSKKTVEEVQGGAAKEKGHSSIEVGKEEKDKSKAEEEIAAVPIVEDVLEGCEVSTLKREVALNKVEDSKKVKKAKKVLKKSRKKIDVVQGSAKKEEEDKAKEVGALAAVPMVEKALEEKDKSKAEEEIAAVPIVEDVLEGCEVSTLKREVALNKVEDSKKVKKPKKVLKKSKKKIEEVQGSAAKEEKDTSKEEEESTALPMVGKVLEDSPKKNLVTNFGVEAFELLQVSNRHTMEDSQREEVTFSPKSPTKTSPPKVAKAADKSQTGKSKKKASPSDLMEQDEELKNEKEAKKATKPKKILSKKKLEEVQGGGAKKDNGSHSNIEFNEGEKDKFEEEEEIAAVPIVGNVLEGSQINVLKRKVALDKEEDSKKVKRPKKILVKSKKTVEEVQGGAAKEKGHSSIEVGKEEKDKSKAEEEIAAVPIVEDVLEGCEVSTLKREVALNKVEDSKKVKKAKKVLKKSRKKIDVVQGSAKKEEEDKAKEVGELAAVPMVEKALEEKDKSKAEEEIAAVSMVEEVLEGCEVSTLKRKAALNKDEDAKKVKKPKKVLKKSKKKVNEVQEEDKAKEVVQASVL